MRLLLTLLAVLIFIPDVEAGGRRSRRYQQQWQPMPTVQPSKAMPAPVSTKVPLKSDKDFSDNALAEVNAERAKRGLPAYINDPLLSKAALDAAAFRAANLIDGHVGGNRGDFAFLPSGAVSNTAGCGALEPSWGWGACGTFDNYTHCGAAWVMGSNGKRFMHAFYR